MGVLVVVGTQWGDEGKGKIVHFLGPSADCIVRFQGGPNAGHTIIFDGKPFVVHTLPSGIVLKNKKCFITNGVVIDPDILMKEVRLLAEKNISVKGRLRISESAHIILEYHRLLDELRERSKVRIGTTKRGIGPSYADKVVRIGIRVCDFLEEKTFFDLLDKNLREKKYLLKKISSLKKVKDTITGKYRVWKKFLVPFVTNTSLELNDAILKNKNILFESAQGTLLDLDFGTYPFVTSSNTISGAACGGAGVGPNRIDYVLGVTKAYTTRVGNGPFPTELKENTPSRPCTQERDTPFNKRGINTPADTPLREGNLCRYLREVGLEYGATTGRPRRIGYFDAVAVRHSVRINGISGLALTKLDCLRGINPLKICVSYKYRGKIISEFPASRVTLRNCKPQYVELDGFYEDITTIKKYSDLPRSVKNYISTIERLVNSRVSLISMGRSREKTIVRDREVLKFHP
ncbi:MAG: adenylosuccinate synthase [Elusimicrobiota bacterium]